MFSNSLKLCFMGVLVMFATESFSSQAGLYFINKSATDKLNIEIRKRFSSYFSARLSMFETNEVFNKPHPYLSLIAESSQQTSIIMLDAHPFKNGFRVSTGIAIKHHRWGFSMAPDVYYERQTVRVDVDKERLRQAWFAQDYEFELEPQHYRESVEFDGRELMVDLELEGGHYELEGFDVDRLEPYYLIDLPAVRIDQSDINVDAQVKFRRYAPYIGFGWGVQLGSHQQYLYSFDLGFIYHGQPKVDLSIDGDVLAVHQLLTDYLYQRRHEKETEINKDLEDFQFMPYLSFGMQAQF